MKKQKSFTVIELLVVVAIIGMIASIVLVSLRGPREKAKIAKALEFSHAIQQSLGADAVGVWKFESIELGDITPDISGYGNDGIVHGATSIEGIKINGDTGNALSFRTWDYVQCQDDKTLDITDEITIELWVNPTTIKHQMLIDRMDWSPHNGYGIWLYLYGEIDFLAGERYCTTAQNIYKVGIWQHIIATADVTTKIQKIYYNGKEVASRTMGDFTAHTGDLYIGVEEKAWMQSPFDGLIDEVRIYNRVLTLAEVQKHYVQGLERLQLVEK